MKRTETREVLCARLFEFDVVAHDADDVGLLLEGVFEIGSGHRGSCQPYCGAWIRRMEMVARVEGCGDLWRRWVFIARGLTPSSRGCRPCGTRVCIDRFS